MSKNKRSLLILAALLVLLCLVFATCGKRSDDAKDESAASTEQVEESGDAEEPEAVEAEDEDGSEVVEEADEADGDEDTQMTEDPDKDKNSKDSKDTNEKKDKKDKKDSSKKKKTSKKKSSKDSSSSSDKPKQKKKVWVPPVTETRTVTLDTGTRYCCGANSNGGCGACWHGTKEGTYNEWKAHWQAYVKKRIAEEAEKGKTYECDHIHDDSRWVPDTTTEEVVIQEGYWKEVDE